jgi:histidyl-tRNA synthetase
VIILISYEPVRGMKDYFGKELEKLKYIEDVFRDSVIKAGYKEIYTPLVEDFKLFALKGGEELRNTMYVFKDKAEREVALRPEFTPSVVRAYLNNMQHLPKPVRLFYTGTVYRYDEPQFGRYREFRQAGVELIGSSSLLSDVEVVSLLAEIYAKLGLLKDIKIKINNIAIFRTIFTKLGVNEDKQEHLLHLIDKGRKEEALKQLDNNSPFFNLLSFLLNYGELKDSSWDEILIEVKKVDNVLIDDVHRIKKISEILSNLGIDVVVDTGFVRGLAYYTGIIFEVNHPKVPFSIAGGGRYDNLIKLYGGPQTPAIGFAIGVERTSLVLNEIKENNYKKAVVFVLDDNEKLIEYGIKIVSKLRSIGIITSLNLKESALSKALLTYVEEGYNLAIFVGNKEYEDKKVTIKNLNTKEQTTIDESKLEDYVKQII